MIIPKDDNKRLTFYSELIQACLASRQRRLEQYATHRRYYLYGTADGSETSPWNKIYSHLDTVTSFLYASDSTRFSIKLGSLAPKSDYMRVTPFTKRINEEWKNSNADIIFQQAILWALVYDTTFVKHIRRGNKVEPFVVDPGSFGVYREDVPMLDRQEAFVHVYYMTKSDLERRIANHPNRDTIIKNLVAQPSQETIAQTIPPIVDRVMLSSTGPMSNVIGNANVNLDMPPDYAAKIEVPLVQMHELWVWDDEKDDYQTVTMAGEHSIIYDRTNIFIPKSNEFEAEHPFVQICPNPLYDYFWGASEVSRLYPLQERRNDRMNGIQRLLAKQIDPPSAWGGMGLSEDKLAAFNEPGAQIAISDPSMKRETFVPTIPPDIYADLKQIDAEFDDVSGLTNTLSGRGESGVRSGGHAQRLLTVGSSRPKKRALIIEDSLEKSAGLFGKLIYMSDTSELEDEEGHKFVIAQMSPHFNVEVDAHSNSPVFSENQKETAMMLLKARAIDRKRFIQMLAPPMQEELIRDLETKIIPGEKALAQQRIQAEAMNAQKTGANKPK